MAKHRTQEQIERDIAAYKALNGRPSEVRPLMDADKRKEVDRYAMQVVKPEASKKVVKVKWF